MKKKNNILDDVKDVYKEAHANGFDTKAVKQIIKLRNMDPKKLEEQDYLLDQYRNALGV